MPLQATTEPVETISPAEERFNRLRGTVGLALAPIVLVALLLAPLPVSPEAHRMAAILAMVVVLWITEALPMAVTAVLGPVLAVVFLVAPAQAALAPFADPIIFLFIGSFILAQAMFVHGVDRRIAYTALSSRLVGASAARILTVYGGVAAALSMWISNTATTAMMFPIGLSIVAHLQRVGASDEDTRARLRQFALAMMLITSFGASIGGMGTPVGTPPNLIGIGMLDRIAGVRISFFQWMTLGVPIVIVIFAFVVVMFYLAAGRGVAVGRESAAVVSRELARLGPVSRGQRNVLLAFSVTVALWIFPGFLAVAGAEQSAFGRAYAASVPEGVAAMIGALLLFVLPVDWGARRFTLTWDEAVRIDWGIVLLYGGGLAMGQLAFSTGLAKAMGEGLTTWLPSNTTFALTALFTAAAIVLSEATSNTASANMIVPIVIAVSIAAGVRPIEPALGATLGASMGFMMPISTAPNAIVYSSGHIPITAMMKYGLALDVAAFVVIVTAVMTLGPILF
ncbi:MAG TPA: DASS family sodium-coupled anion symporter [Vicinamibacterales bacterium]|nr:DASS family sodium-coupled anion symporter [Vicinamibacterales bacterium]